MTLVSPAIPRIVLDTNIILRGLLSRKSAAAQLLTRCEKRDVIVLLSDKVLAEYRFIITSPEIQDRFPSLDHACVELILARLRYLSEWMHVNRRFAFPRIPGTPSFSNLPSQDKQPIW